MDQATSITYTYSDPLSSDETKRNGAFTNLPIRRNRAHGEVDSVAHDLVKTWSDVVNDGVSDGFHGTENGISGNFDSLILPEAQPDRLRHSIWWTQFFFLLDDKAEVLARDIAHGKLNAHTAEILDDAGVKDPSSPLGRVLVPNIRALLHSDYERGLRILQAWKFWLLTTDSKELSDFDNIDDYVEFRTLNSGMLTYPWVVEYTMELTITDAERESVKEVRDLAASCIALSNDWWTWPKEYAAHVTGKSRMLNVVVILMKQHDISAVEARARLKEMTLDLEQQLLDTCTRILANTRDMSFDLQRYIHAHISMVAGNALWESTCPRYHKHLYFSVNDPSPEIVDEGGVFPAWAGSVLGGFIVLSLGVGWRFFFSHTR